MKEIENMLLAIEDGSVFYHIKKIGKDYIELEDKCPKDRDLGNGSLLKLFIDATDKDQTRIVDCCKKIMAYSKKHKKCPEINVDLKLSCCLKEIL